MKKFFTLVLLFVIYTFICLPANADDWALVRLSAVVYQGSFETGDGFTGEDVSDWYPYSDVNTVSQVSNVPGVSGNAIQFTYSIPNQNGLYSGFGYSFNSSDMSPYDSISFWVSGNIKDLKLVLSSEETASVNNYDEYSVSIARFAGKDVTNGFELVTVPFSAFAQQGFASYVPLGDALKKVIAVQVKATAPNASGVAAFDEFVFNADTTAPVAHSLEFSIVGATAGTIGQQQVVNGPFSVSVVVDDNSYLKTVDGYSPVYVITPQGKIDPDLVEITHNAASANYIVRTEFSSPLPSGFNYGLYFGGALTDGAGNTVTQGGVVTENKLVEIAVDDKTAPVVTVQTSVDQYGGVAYAGMPVRVTVNISDNAGFSLGSYPSVYLNDWDGTPDYFNQLSVISTDNGFQYVGEIILNADQNNMLDNGPLYVNVTNVSDAFGNAVNGYYGSFRMLSVIYGTISATSVVKINGSDAYAGDYVSEISNVGCDFTSSATISSYNVRILDASSTVVDQTGWTAVPVPGSSVSVLHTYGSPVALSPGSYDVQVIVEDNDTDRVTESVTLKVSNDLVSDASAAPNPFNPKLGNSNITFFLSQTADVELRVYSISGELQIAEKVVGVQGFNRIQWDGKNDFGETVSNGVYLAYLIVDNGTKEVVKKLKIAVLK